MDYVTKTEYYTGLFELYPHQEQTSFTPYIPSYPQQSLALKCGGFLMLKTIIHCKQKYTIMLLLTWEIKFKNAVTMDTLFTTLLIVEILFDCKLTVNITLKKIKL